MAKISIDPIGKLLGLRHKSHPWHGVEIGENAPDELTCFIEMVPTDTVKYEVDKTTGYLTIDRPQKFSSILPALYGFIPQTYCGKRVGSYSAKALNNPDIVGDGDPLDVCVLTEKDVAHGDVLARAIPIGGFKMIDGNQADDKIIAVLKDDALYSHYKDISEIPETVVNRLKHYFLTYKQMPGELSQSCEISQIYSKEQAHELINLAMDDYREYIERMMFEK
ncbi:MAG: inorganic pyrophosphatase [Bacteroidales bacterium]|nr:inorganic pyrophosphatase [Bacteroidales bacterium]MDD4575948.1 inorganic pyrophosphatase [Bacteroidales bacterium]